MKKLTYGRAVRFVMAAVFSVASVTSGFLYAGVAHATWGGPTCEAGQTTPIAYVGYSDNTVLTPGQITFNTLWSRACGDEAIVSYVWDFGDGSVGEGSRPVHEYHEAGAYTVELTVTDTSGDTDTASAAIRVKDTNIAPFANDFSLVMSRNLSWQTFSLAGNYGDSEGDEVYTLTPVVTSGNAQVSGLGGDTYRLSDLHITAPGQVVTMSYTVKDVYGGTGVGHITVEFTNEAPVANNFELTTHEDSAQSFSLGTYTSDADGDRLEHNIMTQPSHGTVTFSDVEKTYKYVPYSNYVGQDSFVYSVTDGDKVSQGLVNVSVLPVNDKPQTSLATLVTTEDTALVLNPLDGTSDVDGDVISLVSMGAPSGGVVTSNQDGTYTFTPPANQAGVYTIWYTITDGTEQVVTSTNVQVLAQNDAPVISTLTVTKATKGSKVVTVTASASDVDDANLSFAWDFGDGTKRVTTTPSYRYEYQRKGTFTITLIVTDAQGATATKTVTVTI